MGLLSWFQRQPAKPAEADAVALARTRARRRLIGAAVLVVLGIIGFPLVFETQPRPIPVDIPIEIPRKDAAAPLALPTPRSPARPVQRDTPIDETIADAGREVPPPAGAASVPVARPASAIRTAEPAASRVGAASVKPPAPVEPKPTAEPKPTVAPPEAARAKALLEGSEATRASAPAAAAASDSAAARFVVQVGAFADANSVREARSKVERLGLKTYTQTVETPGGSRTRVRVGPFATREEADKALAKARGAGLNAALLTL